MIRINARLDQEYVDKLEVIKNQHHSSITQILKWAIDEYYASHVSASAMQREALLGSGFIGCAEGAADLSESYKEHLAHSRHQA